jgi:hypothetical protein
MTSGATGGPRSRAPATEDVSMAISRRIALAAAITMAAALPLPAVDSGAEPLAPGDVLSRDNASEAEGLLPPEILRHYAEGRFENKLVAWPQGYRWESAFQEATAGNRGKYQIDERGTIVETATGEQPSYVYGMPFPDLDARDPKAAVKILWNAYYNYWYLGNSRNDVRLVWVNPDGVEREAGQDVYFMFYDGQSEPYRVPNPKNLLMQFIATSTYPTDLQGTTALSWRYRDADQRDSSWAYVPGLRRVRAVAPNNRSDGSLGSDLSQDDGPFFDGKPEDFEWKLVEEKEQLRFVDPGSLAGKDQHRWLPQGGWRTEWDPEVKTVGFQDPAWKGVAWAPVGLALAKRPVWVIEATPKDRYYLYGKIQLYVDRETYQGVFNRKFDWRDELINTYMITGLMSAKRVRPDGREDWLWASTQGYQTAENVKMNRATVSALQAPGKDPANDRRVPYDPDFFDFNTLQRFGK